MKKSINQQILDELKKLNKHFEQFSKPEVSGKPVEPQDKPGYIRLDMKDYMTTPYLLEELRKICTVEIYSDPDSLVSERKGNYTVYFKDTQEADEENKNKSADDLKAEGVQGITLEERLLLEIEYFKKYGKNLDVENVTLCSGSRYQDGRVPRVDWNAGGRRVYINWYNPADRGGTLRARSVVLNQ